MRVRANGGGPGGDGETIGDFADDLEGELEALARDLTSGVYRPGPLRRVRIPKPGGKERELAIPCVRDRTVQSALHDLLQPTFEAEFEESSFGYRPGRSVRRAVAMVERLRDAGYTHVVDADILSYFDSVPHERLLAKVQEIVPDARVVDLIGLWLDAFDDTKGLPQGSPISPLLANLYLDDLDEAFSGRGLGIVRFADDFVILCRTPERAERALEQVSEALAREGLTLHPQKTRLVNFDQGFRFLGHLFVRSLVLRSPQPNPPPTLPRPPALDIVEADEAEDEPAPAVLERAAKAFGDPAAPEPTVQQTEGLKTDQVPESAGLVGEEAEADTQDPRRAPAFRPLYVYEQGRRLGLINQSFAVFEGEDTLFAAAPARVDRIEIGPEVTVEADVLRQALAHGVSVVFVDGRGAPLGHLEHTVRQRGRVHLAQAQAVLDQAQALRLAAAFVNARLHNQRALLHRLNRRRKDVEVRTTAHRIGRILLKLRIAESLDTVRGIEGEGSALYWSALRRTLPPAFQTGRRVRREGASPLDVLLDFAAHLVTREVESLVLKHGLHPQFGLLHAPRDRGNPVAWDLVEAFRAPLAEGFVVYLINNRIIGSAHFGKSDDGVMLFPPGRERFIRTYESWLARSIQDPRTGKAMTWRGLMDAEVRAFRTALLNGEPFEPYRMDY